MRRRFAVLGSVVFFFAAPGTVAGLVPWWITLWHFKPLPAGFAAHRWVAVAMILGGLVPLVAAFARFAWQGLGTPAPTVLPLLNSAQPKIALERGESAKPG